MFLYQFEKQEGNDKLLKSALTISDKNWYSIKPCHYKTYTRGVFRTQFNISNKTISQFLQRCCAIDVRLGSKYTEAYIYIQVSPIEIICILNIFAVKHTLLQKKNELK